MLGPTTHSQALGKRLQLPCFDTETCPMSGEFYSNQTLTSTHGGPINKRFSVKLSDCSSFIHIVKGLDWLVYAIGGKFEASIIQIHTLPGRRVVGHNIDKCITYTTAITGCSIRVIQCKMTALKECLMMDSLLMILVGISSPQASLALDMGSSCIAVLVLGMI